jgi:hypothetical protein
MQKLDKSAKEFYVYIRYKDNNFQRESQWVDIYKEVIKPNDKTFTPNYEDASVLSVFKMNEDNAMLLVRFSTESDKSKFIEHFAKKVRSLQTDKSRKKMVA